MSLFTDFSRRHVLLVCVVIAFGVSGCLGLGGQSPSTAASATQEVQSKPVFTNVSTGYGTLNLTLSDDPQASVIIIYEEDGEVAFRRPIQAGQKKMVFELPSAPQQSDPDKTPILTTYEVRIVAGEDGEVVQEATYTLASYSHGWFIKTPTDDAG